MNGVCKDRFSISDWEVDWILLEGFQSPCVEFDQHQQNDGHLV